MAPHWWSGTSEGFVYSSFYHIQSLLLDKIHICILTTDFKICFANDNDDDDDDDDDDEDDDDDDDDDHNDNDED